MSSDLDTQFRPPAKYRPEIKRISKRLAKILTPLAHEMGYALMTHGSLERDLDLLAVPWVEEAVDPRELVKALAKAAGGYWSTEPAKKPHGREAYTIILRRAVETPAGCFPFIDLSVMPVTAPGEAVADGWVMVPREITLEMQHAYFKVVDRNLRRVETDCAFGRYDSQKQAYRAMIAARPKEARQNDANAVRAEGDAR